MKKKILLTIIPIICFALIIGILLYENLSKKDSKIQALADADIDPAERDIDEYGFDCTLITEGELFEYLNEQYRANKNEIVSAPDGKTYSVVEYSMTPRYENRTPVSWVETLSNEEAALIVESDLYDKIFCESRIGEQREENTMHAIIMEAKLLPYLQELDSKLYFPTPISNLSESYHILYAPKSVIVRVTLSNAAIGMSRFGYFRVTYDECKDWMIPVDFNAPPDYDGLSDEEILEICTVLYNFYINAEEHLIGNVKGYMEQKAKECLDVLNSLSCPDSLPSQGSSFTF